MPNRSKQVRWIIAVGVIVLLGVLLRSSFQGTREQYQVCVSFGGASHCATASGATPAEAIRSAQQIDCQLLAANRNQNMVCLDTQPTVARPINWK